MYPVSSGECRVSAVTMASVVAKVRLINSHVCTRHTAQCGSLLFTLKYFQGRFVRFVATISRNEPVLAQNMTIALVNTSHHQCELL